MPLEGGKLGWGLASLTQDSPTHSREQGVPLIHQRQMFWSLEPRAVDNRAKLSLT